MTGQRTDGETGHNGCHHAAGPYDAKEAFGLARGEDVIGERPELNHEQGTHGFNKDVEYGVEPGTGYAQHQSGQQNPYQQGAGDSKNQSVPPESISETIVCIAQGAHDQGHPNVHVWQVANVVAAEKEGVSGDAAGDEGTDRRHQIQKHTRGAIPFLGPDGQSAHHPSHFRTPH